MISKKLFPIIIFIYFLQYVSERNSNYFNFQKVSKKNVLMHRPSIKKSLPQVPLNTRNFCLMLNPKKVGITNLVTMPVLINFLSRFTLHLSFIVFENKYLPQLTIKNLLLHLEVAILGRYICSIFFYLVHYGLSMMSQGKTLYLPYR